jgi:phage protein D
MDFAARSDAFHGLYAPAATVCLGVPGLDMLQAHGLAVTQVEVDLQLSVAGTFKFTVPNTFDAARADFLTMRGDRVLDLVKLGTRVWIRMGYGDRAGQALMLSGYITTVGTSFAEGGSPELEVSGQDALYRLTLGTSEHQFRDSSVFQAVTKVASDNGFVPRLSGSAPTNVSLDSNMQTDLDFIRKLAENFSTAEKKWEFYSRATETGDELHFRPRQTDAAPVGQLAWGIDLLNFKPEANLGNQVSKVEVHGWDQVAKTAIVGSATRAPGPSNDPGRSATSGGQLQTQLFGREAVLTLRYPVKTKQEADERAAAELAKRAKDHVRGDGECFGYPLLLPDTNIRLAGLGTKFSTSYFVEKVVHRYDASGYRTRFSIQETVS